MQRSEKRAALISANNLLNIYLIMCNHSLDMTRLLVVGGQQLIFSLISLRQTCEERGTVERVLLLLQILVTKLMDNGQMDLSEGQGIGGNESGSGRIGVGNGVGTAVEGKGTEVEEKLKKAGLKESLRGFFCFKSAVEAVKRNDKGMWQCVICVYVPAL